MGATRGDPRLEPEDFMSPQHHDDGTDPVKNARGMRLLAKALIVILTCVVLYVSYMTLFNQVVALGLAGSSQGALVAGKASHDCKASSTSVPQYFQTSPELWAGPTATGRPPFLAQTNPVSFAPTATFAPNAPLETAEPITGQGQNESIFHLMAHLSPYFPNPSGFGVAEYPLPPGASISQLQVSNGITPNTIGTNSTQMLSRHGSRYPTLGSNVYDFGTKVANNTKFEASGPLSFLNEWKFELGAEILVPRGRQELFESGVLHYYQYGQLYNPHSKLIVRTTTQDRMLKVSFPRPTPAFRQLDSEVD